MAVCAFPDCGRPVSPRVIKATLCRAHHDMKTRGEPLRPLRVIENRIGCDFPGCTDKHRAKGYCQTHWGQQKRGVDMYAIDPRTKRKPPAKGAPKAAKLTSKMPAGWERVTPPPASKPHRAKGGIKVLAVEGPVIPATPEQQAAALHVFRLLCPDEAPLFAEACGIQVAA